MNFNSIAQLVDHKAEDNCCDVSKLFENRQKITYFKQLSQLEMNGPKEDRFIARKLIFNFISLGLFRYSWFDRRLMYIDSTFPKCVIQEGS